MHYASKTIQPPTVTPADTSDVPEVTTEKIYNFAKSIYRK